LFAKLTRDEFLAHHAIAPGHEAQPVLR
jgi:hypothetical protein